ncbi:MAG: DUF1311 domain-containing protein [Neomegalonema sp.]|nr:DUF1311 domain-containing protein [Neomegalonema sp.]
MGRLGVSRDHALRFVAIILASLVGMNVSDAGAESAAARLLKPSEAYREIQACLVANKSAEAKCESVSVAKCLAFSENETTLGQTGCASAAVEAWERVMKAAYQKASSGLKAYGSKDQPRAPSLGQLRTGQKGWAAYVAGQCELDGGVAHGGSLQRVIAVECVRAKTAARALELRALVKSYGW